ncbi:recombination protein RecR [Patescibacteria group bacterium]|nr:recombination protein RecR [Patescibacteria group bacterium]
MNYTIQKLAEYFEKLPGIGPRQARRFVYALLNKDVNFLEQFSKSILGLKKDMRSCPECRRFFESKNNENCQICRDVNRNKNILLVAEKDVDLDNIEKAGIYDGFYFVLGGLVPAVGSEMPSEVKMKKLFEKVKKEVVAKNLKEIILAFSATPEGENTALYIEKILEPINKKFPIKINRLGRGLSTGTELEYADSDTLKNALERRG